MTIASLVGTTYILARARSGVPAATRAASSTRKRASRSSEAREDCACDDALHRERDDRDTRAGMDPAKGRKEESVLGHR